MNGEPRAQSSASVESDGSSDETIKTAIKAPDPPNQQQPEQANDQPEEEHRLESRNPFADEEELEDIQLELDEELQQNEPPNEQKIDENGTKENGHAGRVSVEDYEDQSSVVDEQPKAESPKLEKKEDVQVINNLLFIH
jgi:hypothetical protein